MRNPKPYDLEDSTREFARRVVAGSILQIESKRFGSGYKPEPV